MAFSTGDPVGTGLVDNLARPSGHVTGISDMTIELSPKRLQLLKELVTKRSHARTLDRIGGCEWSEHADPSPAI